MADPQANKALVRDFLATFSSGDVDGILDRLDDRATWWVSGGIDGLSGAYAKQTLGGLLRQVTAVYVGGALRITPTGMIAEGDKVAVEAESFAELTNGRVYKNSYHFLFEIADGRILSVKEYMDTMHAHATFIA